MSSWSYSSNIIYKCMKISNQELGTMAERLRRKIRNLLGFSRAGSSPAGVVYFFDIFMY